MAKTTKTLNPLHFEDLEPHRFEDLIRQLSYGLRSWHSIEAVGRKGADEGIDIRAIERNSEEISQEFGDDSGEVTEHVNLSEKRTWIIQCKREQEMGPSKVERVVDENLTGYDETPDVYVLAAACDFSKSSRDVFREVLIKHDVDEFHLWGKAELEDMLFLPQNDYLLFAYFGISLQVKRRSTKTEVRSKLATKRKLNKRVGEIRDSYFDPVFIRDPENKSYPKIEDPEEFLKNPSWRYWRIFTHYPPDKVAFVTKESYAYLDSERRKWDFFANSDQSWPHQPELTGIPDELIREKFNDPNKYWKYWKEEVPSDKKAKYFELRFIPYERILEVDDIGDVLHEPPHLLVDYLSNELPFENGVTKIVQHESQFEQPIRIEKLEKIDYFPHELESTNDKD